MVDSDDTHRARPWTVRWGCSLPCPRATDGATSSRSRYLGPFPAFRLRGRPGIAGGVERAPVPSDLVLERIDEQVDSGDCRVSGLQGVAAGRRDADGSDASHGRGSLVIEQSTRKWVFGSRGCPSGDTLLDRPSWHVSIIDESCDSALEYTRARVVAGYRVVVYLQPEVSDASGRGHHTDAL